MTYQCFAIAAPGLEPLVVRELDALGVRGDAVPGGVTFHATSEQLYTANLWLRVASRVIVRLATFRAAAFYELERHARRVSFERYIERGAAVDIHVSCRKSRLYHSDAVAERVRQAIERRTGSVVRTVGDASENGTLIIVRLSHDECTVSIDSSGALLHRRGYRLATAKAPMRETLAAAMLSGWNGDAALVDPFCGSGTIPIEAALIARRRAPGIARTFAFMQWPEYDPALWATVLERARSLERPSTVRIVGSDRDAGGIQAARENAARAGVDGDIELRTQTISELESPAETGWLVTNPPWGVRVGEESKLRDLYARLGQVAKKRLPGWHLAILAPEAARLGQAAQLPLTPSVRTVSGGIPVAILDGAVPGKPARL
ncbi:MAG TPA: class I SAM-dependent RNA methyltransferase [Gemmatimonadaceae bacterium]|nr:class I SAM-dependent RNA methyltransferase [Gemmatimonadaceae bacterium]